MAEREDWKVDRENGIELIGTGFDFEVLVENEDADEEGEERVVDLERSTERRGFLFTMEAAGRAFEANMSVRLSWRFVPARVMEVDGEDEGKVSVNLVDLLVDDTRTGGGAGSDSTGSLGFGSSFFVGVNTSGAKSAS